MMGYTVPKGTKVLVWKDGRWQWRTAKDTFYFYVEDIKQQTRNGRIEVNLKANRKDIPLVSVSIAHCLNHHDDTKAINMLPRPHVYVGKTYL